MGKKLHLVWESPEGFTTPWGPLKVEQLANTTLRITYGKHVKDCRTRDEAIAELGSCMMHWFACDNRMRGDE